MIRLVSVGVRPTAVIVGAGLAGGKTAEALRHKGFSGNIVLLGAEEHAPYDRPPLSNSVFHKGVRDTSLRLDLFDVDLRLGERALSMHGNVVRTTRGALEFDVLVAATGSYPVRLPGSGARTLRTIEDALALEQDLVPGAHVVVVGAGWLGADLATAARQRRCTVTVVEAGALPLHETLGPEVSRMLLPIWQRHGVDLKLGTRVVQADAHRVALADGTELAADVVVVAVGVRPDVDWLIGGDLALDRGVLVDAQCRSVSRPDVFAVGDAAAWWSRRYGRVLRLPHWDDAMRAPETVASVLTGRPDAVHDPVPYRWSEQFGRTLQLAGTRTSRERLVWRGDAHPDRWTACWIDDGNRLRALATVGRPGDLVGGRVRIDGGEPVDPRRLADPAYSLHGS
jgi:NADPH-dependent 2,4-dienoyl-CoA reductase/sulfur reductase-like enzyme